MYASASAQHRSEKEERVFCQCVHWHVWTRSVILSYRSNKIYFDWDSFRPSCACVCVCIIRFSRSTHFITSGVVRRHFLQAPSTRAVCFEQSHRFYRTPVARCWSTNSHGIDMKNHTSPLPQHRLSELDSTNCIEGIIATRAIGRWSVRRWLAQFNKIWPDPIQTDCRALL